MTLQARESAKIETTTVERRAVQADIRLVGKIAFDETRTRTVAARFPARIDKLYVDYTGIEVRETMGLSNVWAMVPFVRTLDEARAVIDVLAEFGLRRGENGLKIMMMCELPSNALLAREFLEHFDGFSIGSNDLTQLTLGLDRDSAEIAELFDERDPAVKAMLAMGASRPWPDALEAISGERAMDASALVEYFDPLVNWIGEQNQGRTCGW